MPLKLFIAIEHGIGIERCLETGLFEALLVNVEMSWWSMHLVATRFCAHDCL